MAKDPAFLFYSSDFLTGVSDLTMEERGQYITLLCLQHQKGRLSEKMIKITVPNVSNDVLSKFDADKQGFFYNKRLELEADKRVNHSKKQSQRAKDGWKKRKATASATASATAMPLENENVIVNRVIIDKDKGRGVGKPLRMKKPTLEEIKDHMKSKNGNLAESKIESEAENFFNYYESNGWKVGKNPMANWKASATNWINRASDFKSPFHKETDQERMDRIEREFLSGVKDD